MQANLEISRTTVNCASSWTGTYIIGGAYEYSTPTWDYADIYLTVPTALIGSVFQSVTLSYSVNGTGTKKMVFLPGSESYSNAKLLTRLQAGQTSIRIQFGFKATGGSGGSGTHTAYCTWSNLRATVDYLPASNVNGTVAFSDSSVYYSCKQDGVALGETADFVFAVTPSVAATRLRMDVRESGQTDYKTYTYEISAAAGAQTAVSGQMAFTGLTLTERVTTAQIRFILETASGNQSSAWTDTSLKLIRERTAPVLTPSWSDTGTGMTRTGVYVQGQSVLTCTVSAVLDTAADPSITVTSRGLTINGTTYVSGSDTFDGIDTSGMSGDVPVIIKYIDSHGKTGQYIGTINITAYSLPSVTAMSIERYAQKYDSHGDPYYEQDDDSTTVWVNLTAAVTAVNSRNAWTLKASNGTTELTLASGTDGQSITYTQDRTLITASFPTTSTALITLVLADQFGTTQMEYLLPKAGGIFSIEEGGVAIGQRCSGSALNPVFEVNYPATFKSTVVIADTGWTGVPLASGVSASSAGLGSFAGLGYRIEHGHHIIVAASLSFTASTSAIYVNTAANPLPKPTRGTYVFFTCAGTRMGRAFVNTDGQLGIEWVYPIGSSTKYTGSITWTDILLEYWI